MDASAARFPAALDVRAELSRVAGLAKRMLLSPASGIAAQRSAEPDDKGFDIGQRLVVDWPPGASLQGTALKAALNQAPPGIVRHDMLVSCSILDQLRRAEFPQSTGLMAAVCMEAPPGCREENIALAVFVGSSAAVFKAITRVGFEYSLQQTEAFTLARIAVRTSISELSGTRTHSCATSK